MSALGQVVACVVLLAVVFGPIAVLCLYIEEYDREDD